MYPQSRTVSRLRELLKYCMFVSLNISFKTFFTFFFSLIIIITLQLFLKLFFGKAVRHRYFTTRDTINTQPLKDVSKKKNTKGPTSSHNYRRHSQIMCTNSKCHRQKEHVLLAGSFQVQRVARKLQYKIRKKGFVQCDRQSQFVDILMLVM